MIVWTAVIENPSTGIIRTPEFQAPWSCKAALLSAHSLIDSRYERIVCVLKGAQSQIVYPSVDNVLYGHHEDKVQS